MECLIYIYVLVCGYPANPGSEASKHHLASRTLMSPSPRMSPSEICDFVFEDEKRKIWTRSGAECENLLSVYNCILPWPFGPIFHQKGCTLQSLPIDIFQPKTVFSFSKNTEMCILCTLCLLLNRLTSFLIFLMLSSIPYFSD